MIYTKFLPTVPSAVNCAALSEADPANISLLVPKNTDKLKSKFLGFRTTWERFLADFEKSGQNTPVEEFCLNEEYNKYGLDVVFWYKLTQMPENDLLRKITEAPLEAEFRMYGTGLVNMKAVSTAIKAKKAEKQAHDLKRKQSKSGRTSIGSDQSVGINDYTALQFNGFMEEKNKQALFEREATIAKNIALYNTEISKAEDLLDELEFETSAKAIRKRKRLTTMLEQYEALMEETCAARAAASADKKMTVGANKKREPSDDDIDDDIATPLIVY